MCAFASPLPAHAHTDDPKVFDRLPPWNGPSFRESVSPRGAARGAFDASGITLRAMITLTEFESEDQASDCWGYTSPSGREYAIMCLHEGTAFVEVTNPANPQIVYTNTSLGATSIWRDVKVFGHYCYSANEAFSGIQVFDMSQIDSGTVTRLANVQTGGSTSTHNLVVDEQSGYLYRCGGGTNLGLRIYNLNIDPGAPNFVSQWTDRYVHDAQVVVWNTGPHAGKQIAVCCSGSNDGSVNTGLELLDVTNKSNITQLGRIVYPNGAYAHQVWISPDQQYAYVNDELDELNAPFISSTTLVFDISDPTDPTLVNTFTNGSAAITHNNYVHNGMLFAANYTDGLRVFDLADPVNGIEVAHFDTRPEDDATAFHGLWSVYPFFPSGTIIGSDRERGLFVWTMGSSELCDGDANGDNTIDVNDISYVLFRLGNTGAPGEVDGDANGDGTVDVNDISYVLFRLGPCV